MKTFSTDVVNALNSSAVALVQLIELSFAVSPIYLNTSTWTLTHEGKTYLGADGLGSISAVTDQPGEVQGLEFELFADAAHVSLALDASDTVQGTPCAILSAIVGVNENSYTVLDTLVDWTGYLDTMTITEDGAKAVVKVTAESRAVDLLHGNNWTYTDADQRLVDASDGSFSFVISQTDKPVVWPAKEFYYK